ncbi:MAG: hypothetical protein IAG13_24010, partial [Deltaproteobacteria bacterium]|nr:hypothetical protein [Nannocystaceae bacterium]
DGAPPRDFARVRAALARAVAVRDPIEAAVLAAHARTSYLELDDPAGHARMDALLAELAGDQGSTSPAERGAISKPL